MRRRLAAVLTLLGSLLLASVAHANPPTRDQVRQLLSGYEHVPGAGTWRTLGPEALPVLIALYDDAREAPYVRIRAVGATAHFPVAATRTFLRAVATAPGQSDLFIREAVLALGRAFGARAVDDVRPFLDSAEPVVREAAAMALGRIRTPAATSALRRRLATESERNVRETIERQLARR